ncbi:transcription termination/antitermination NusG family protein [Thomasclavelia cocleata]|uniref:transcription termination/antitermination NusG family protein n=1 Tax=Thomasclavelia cocleata TaxID=69824 RepID=UPI00242F010B|nr:transcription termination/antitermination NusG family protein [Thomasclavelia cocleata]
MYWYIVHIKLEQSSKLVKFFNQQNNTIAFVPKMERWYNIKGKKNYIIKDLYPDYVFIKSEMDQLEFNERFKEFFKSIDGIAQLLEFEDVYVLKTEEQILMERLLDNKNIIRHSVGNIVNSKLIVEKGPLVNLENKVIKIDRHQRLAVLKSDFFNKITVPLEVVSKS